MNTLWQIDHQLFQLINSGLSNSVFDLLMPMLREKLIWLPLYVFMVAFIVCNSDKKAALACLVGMTLSVMLADVISSRVLKPLVGRERPCQYGVAIERVHCGSGYSFPSSHAANHFALAMFLSMIPMERKRAVRRGLFIWAGSIALAQVYVGVHYPIDVVCGALLGCAIGWAVARWVLRDVRAV